VIQVASFTLGHELSALRSFPTALRSPQTNQIPATALKLPIRRDRNDDQNPDGGAAPSLQISPDEFYSSVPHIPLDYGAGPF
jgi:hypothetical protein